MTDANERAKSINSVCHVEKMTPKFQFDAAKMLAVTDKDHLRAVLKWLASCGCGL